MVSEARTRAENNISFAHFQLAIDAIIVFPITWEKNCICYCSHTQRNGDNFLFALFFIAGDAIFQSKNLPLH